jgi:hypothetical protein
VVRQYVAVSQNEPRLAVWERDPSGRLALASGLDGLDGELALPSIDTTLQVKEIYEGLGFEPETERS